MNILFEFYKDKPISRASDFKAKTKMDFKLTEEQARELFIRVSNYKIEKYGETLQDGEHVIKIGKEEILAIKTRKKQNRKYWGLKKCKKDDLEK